ncbi:MAG: CHAD domain-containing protein [Propionibacteriales bacterium]|nr:CHAD domain-containing protein [Propionibacteriales bacterium]
MTADSRSVPEVPNQLAATRKELPPPSLDGPAWTVLGAHIAAQVAAIVELEPQVRADRHDAVHQMRVACRRLRSALATFRRLVDRDVTDPVRGELRWLAGVLGEARDVEVMLDRLRTFAAMEPPDVAGEESSTHLELALREAGSDARVRVVQALDSARYSQLLDDLVAIVAQPPWTSLAHQPARKVLPKQVRRDWKRLRSDVAVAEGASTPEARAELLHDVRKTSKRLRYANDALAPAFGRDAKRLAKAAERLQTVLGDHHDGVVSQQLLMSLAARPGLDASHVLLYGRLHALEQAQRAETEPRYAKAWKQVAKKRLRSWLKP